MFVEILVTEEDIRNGVRCDPCRCAMALALTRAYKVPVRVDREGAHIGDAAVRPLAMDLKEWVEKFDRGEKMTPVRVYENYGQAAVRENKVTTR